MRKYLTNLEKGKYTPRKSIMSYPSILRSVSGNKESLQNSASKSKMKFNASKSYIYEEDTKA